MQHEDSKILFMRRHRRRLTSCNTAINVLKNPVIQGESRDFKLKCQHTSDVEQWKTGEFLLVPFYTDPVNLHDSEATNFYDEFFLFSFKNVNSSDVAFDSFWFCGAWTVAFCIYCLNHLDGDERTRSGISLSDRIQYFVKSFSLGCFTPDIGFVTLAFFIAH